ncbi:bifunctional alpha/beta hydrolase/OsmC family protein [Wenyingzhuangia sp. 2_MG-2023]|uniref:bifunctional alpha/beta hydrolase/OsmC family protein n=1 Tax=Wenyingzhuangia sp. 2_MG-2023 TaxID=3062639 RepID=UPI0026E2B640|nr:bifunctional alpha/beta hydrolase/OsmC family protein [Wenyingzhuangia sp. 2_MG-2023]MDO6738848.1 bifunctional alpha/beta hydrolase/OsmC family protein [Wenyingzhuangia sp. 2_MG-2023]
MKTKNISFKNSKGILLSAKLELPADQHPDAYAIFAHCFTCNKNLTAVRNISKALTQNGFGVLLFDFTGLGQSEGDFSETNFTSNIQDLEDVSEYMTQELQAPKLIVGHSLGGAAAIFAGKNISSIQAIATIGAPSSPQHIQHLFKNDIEKIEANGKAIVTIGGRSFPISKQLIDDISKTNMHEVVKTLRKPLLLLHSPQDTVVGIHNASEIYAQAMHPKSFVSLDGADHLLSNKEDSLYAGQIIAHWGSRYIDKSTEKKLKTSEQVVARIGNNGFTTDIIAAGHSLTADEPENVGGNNFGPSPYNLLLSSLGACTAMTLRMYADRKQWDLEEVIVHLSHNKDYAQDCKECDQPKSKIDLIEKRIELIGNLDETQKKRLLEIADKCPVHKTLHQPVSVTTTLIS